VRSWGGYASCLPVPDLHVQFRSPCPDRSAKFDVALSGPIAGGALSLAMFAAGLALTVATSATGTEPSGGTLAAGIQELVANELIPVPSLLFQGSLLLGLDVAGGVGIPVRPPCPCWLWSTARACRPLAALSTVPQGCAVPGGCSVAGGEPNKGTRP